MYMLTETGFSIPGAQDDGSHPVSVCLCSQGDLLSGDALFSIVNQIPKGQAKRAQQSAIVESGCKQWAANQSKDFQMSKGKYSLLFRACFPESQSQLDHDLWDKQLYFI